MNPNTVFSASLVTSLVLWLPSMQACLRGDLDLVPAALRYLAALVVSRLALNGLARLVNAYRATRRDRHAGEGPSPGRERAALRGGRHRRLRRRRPVRRRLQQRRPALDPRPPGPAGPPPLRPAARRPAGGPGPGQRRPPLSRA